MQEKEKRGDGTGQPRVPPMRLRQRKQNVSDCRSFSNEQEQPRVWINVKNIMKGPNQELKVK